MTLATFILIGTIILTIFYQRKNVLCEGTNDRVKGPAVAGCISEECIKYSRALPNKVNINIRPCDDFYGYACGKAGQVTEFERLKSEANKSRLYLGDKINDTESEPTKKAKAIFQNCLTIGTKKQPVLNMIKKLGGWPILENRTDACITWGDYFETFTRENLTPDDFFQIKLVTRKTEVKDYYLFIETIRYGEFNTTKERNIKNGLHIKILDLLRDILKLFGATDNDEINFAIDDYITFTNGLIFATKQEANFTVMKLEELQTNIRGIPWLKILKAVLNPIDIIINRNSTPNTTHYLYADDLYIKVACPSCIKFVNELATHARNREFVNYVMFRTVIKAIPYFSEEFRKRLHDIQTLLEGLNTTISGQNYSSILCTRILAENCLKWSESYDFLVRNNLYNVKEPVTSIANFVKEQLVDAVRSATWLSETTRDIAVGKIGSIYYNIAYPEYLTNESYIKWFDEPLQGLNLSDPDNFWNVMLILNRIQNNKKILNFVERSPEGEQWIPSLTTPETIFDITNNSLTIPLAYLQRDVYLGLPEFPQYMNYGTIGFLIGYGMMHSIIGNGTNFTNHKTGKREQWMLPKDNITYHNRKNCFVNQYKEWYKPNSSVPQVTEKLINEIIAEREAIELAYHAFMFYRKDTNIEEPADPDEGWITTKPQILFWIQYARLWCTQGGTGGEKDYRDENLSLPVIRVWNAVVNSKVFANVFGCNETDLMNPPNKCSMYS